MSIWNRFIPEGAWKSIRTKLYRADDHPNVVIMELTDGRFMVCHWNEFKPARLPAQLEQAFTTDSMHDAIRFIEGNW